MDSCLSVAQVRKRVAQALTESGLEQSRQVPDLFGLDPSQFAHQAFAVVVPSSIIEDFDGRDNYGDEGEARTVLEVRVSHHIRGDDPQGDYDAALDFGQRVMSTVLCDTDRSKSMKLAILSVPERTVSPEADYFLSRIRFQATHRYRFVV